MQNLASRSSRRACRTCKAFLHPRLDHAGHLRRSLPCIVACVDAAAAAAGSAACYATRMPALRSRSRSGSTQELRGQPRVQTGYASSSNRHSDSNVATQSHRDSAPSCDTAATGIMRTALVLAVLAALLNVGAVRAADDPSVTLPGVVDLSAYRPAQLCMHTCTKHPAQIWH